MIRVFFFFFFFLRNREVREWRAGQSGAAEVGQSQCNQLPSRLVSEHTLELPLCTLRLDSSVKPHIPGEDCRLPRAAPGQGLPPGAGPRYGGQ